MTLLQKMNEKYSANRNQQNSKLGHQNMRNSQAQSKANWEQVEEKSERGPSAKQGEYNEIGKQETKHKKIDIKRLIEMKEMRQLKQAKVKSIPAAQKYYEKVQSLNIYRCLLCGFVIFCKQGKQEQKQKINHTKSAHPEYEVSGKFLPQSNNGNMQDYQQIATDLVHFVNDEQNIQTMQLIIGQPVKPPFKPYVQSFPVRQQLVKWAKSIGQVYNLI